MPSRRDCRSRRAREASAFRSSGLQLSVWRSDGIRTLQSSLAATTQDTSGGGGEGGRSWTALGCPVDMLDKLRRIRTGSATLAVEACVGDE